MSYEDEQLFHEGRHSEDSEIETHEALEEISEDIAIDPIIVQYEKKLLELTPRETILNRYIAEHEINPLYEREVRDAKKELAEVEAQQQNLRKLIEQLDPDREEDTQN